MGEKVKRFGSEGAETRSVETEEEIDAQRADRVLPVLAHLLGSRHA